MWLLAEANPVPTVSTAPPDPGVIHHPAMLGWIALAMLISTVATWLVFRWRSVRLVRRQNSPPQLFRELAALHQLNWSERSLLTSAARKQKLADPARLFLEPELWRASRDGERSSTRRYRLTLLERKLLGEETTPTAPPA
jgi:hypothetical protein